MQSNREMKLHVAIIMDGNGRWAGRRSLKRFLGHQQGAKSVQLVTETASRIGLPWLTLYAFSLENNLRRPKAEVTFLMRLLKSYLESNLQRMMDNNVRIRYIGRTHELPPEVQDHVIIRDVAFHDAGDGHLLLTLDGDAQLTNEQLQALENKFKKKLPIH